MAIRTKVTRNAGHPWDGIKRPGFDLLEVSADTEAEMAVLVAAAKVKHWEPWLIGRQEETNLPGGALYKPCDIAVPWEDSPDNPHPGCPRLSAEIPTSLRVCSPSL